MDNKVVSIGNWTDKEQPPPIDDADIPPERYDDGFEIPEKAANPQVDVDLAVYDIREFARLPGTPREALVAPAIVRGSLTAFYGKRGCGKTTFATAVAYSYATGQTIIDGWTVEKPGNVLIIDGEMPFELLQERYSLLGRLPENRIKILALTAQKDLKVFSFFDFSKGENQARLEKHIAKADLIVFDSVGRLFRVKKTQAEEDWRSCLDYTIYLRGLGKAVLFVAHSGKMIENGIRGSISFEDALDTIIELTTKSRYSDDKGCNFDVRFTKNRFLWGKDVAPFHLQMYTEDFTQKWVKTPIEDKEPERQKDKTIAEKREDAVGFIKAGYKNDEIMEELKKKYGSSLSKTTIAAIRGDLRFLESDVDDDFSED